MGNRKFIGTGHLGDRPVPNIRQGKKVTMDATIDCVFCEIIAEMAPAEDFRKHGQVVSFVPLNPVVPGHRLFVPVNHHDHAADGALDAAIAFLYAAEWGRENCNPLHGFNLITSAGEVASQSIKHTHIHYVPRKHKDGLLLPWGGVKPVQQEYSVPTYDGKPYELGDDRYPLYRADKDCIHQIETQWSGYKCVKCEGWYCA